MLVRRCCIPRASRCTSVVAVQCPLRTYYRKLRKDHEDTSDSTEDFFKDMPPPPDPTSEPKIELELSSVGVAKASVMQRYFLGYSIVVVVATWALIIDPYSEGSSAHRRSPQ